MSREGGGVGVGGGVNSRVSNKILKQNRGFLSTMSSPKDFQ